MKLAIMQPYIFPYIGYFQLVAAVDRFVIYDDVTFIKQGWINRNNILVNNNAHLFTVPLEKASSFTNIKDTFLNPKFYPAWRDKFLKTITQNYKKAPLYSEAFNLVESVLSAECDTISQLATNSITKVADYLGLKTAFVPSSTIYNNSNLKSQERVLDICRQEKASSYINPIGGQELYSRADFSDKGLTLHFIKSRPVQYRQFSETDFIPWLSIIDQLMFVEKPELTELLNQYDLI